MGSSESAAGSALRRVGLNANTGLDLVRATEAAAIAAARLMGRGAVEAADAAAAEAMAAALAGLDIAGRLVVADDERHATRELLPNGAAVGRGGPISADLVVDPIDGRRQLAQGRNGAVAFAAVTEREALWQPGPARYIDKVIVGPKVAPYLVPECLDAPAAWTLALVARALHRSVADLAVFVLDRPRHADLINEIRAAGARVMLADDGDIYGALLAVTADTGVDLLLGVGRTTEALLSACAVRAIGGAMLARPAPQSPQEFAELRAAGSDLRQILQVTDLVRSDQIFFVGTGITDSVLLKGVRLDGARAATNSLILRAATRTRRLIFADHQLSVH